MSQIPELSHVTSTNTAKRKRRVYQACEPCRIRKAKCDRGSDDDPSPLPCARCRRESIQSHCIIAERRTRRFKLDELASRQTELVSTNTVSTSTAGTSTITSTVNVSPTEQGLQRSATEYERHGSSNSPALSYVSINRGQLTSPQSVHSRDELYLEAHDFGPENSHESTSGEGSSSRLNSQRNLTDNVIQTLVTKPNDALTLLFEAAGREEPSALNSRQPSPDRNLGDAVHTGATSGREFANNGPSPANAYATPHSARIPMIDSLPKPSSAVVELWKRSRFVRQGWLLASQAILYIDLFFLNLSPLSPIISNYYADHKNHHALIHSEPMLCVTILTISSRYHILQGDGGILRSDDIHRKFWLHWKKLYTRVLYGQEAKSKVIIRTVGTIESLLLMTEWHARALHFPLDLDGSDDEIPDEIDDEPDRMDSNSRDCRKSTAEIEGAARRSDKMSWMLLGSALTLAHELGISDQRLQDRDLASKDFSSPNGREQAEFIELRRSRPRRLLYIYINQLASRLGWSSMIPRIISDSAEPSLGGEADRQWYNVTSRWISLTRLMKTASDMLFSPVTMKQLLRTGNYVTSLEHFGHLLQDWNKEYDTLRADKRLLDILSIEFQFTRAYINSLAVQAVVDRAFQAAAPQYGPTDFVMTCVFERHSVDWTFIQEVVDGSRRALKKVLELNENGHLRYCPVRIFSRITSASILLLKATGLGARVEEAQLSLELLSQLVDALRFDPVDELHLANRYASLLETHLKAFRRRFFRVGRSRDSGNQEQSLVDRITSTGEVRSHSGPVNLAYPNVGTSANIDTNVSQIPGDRNVGVAVDGFEGGLDMSFWGQGNGFDLSDDWMCLPLDAFEPSGNDFTTALGAGGLDFFYMGT
ncbi:hypothetical protein BGZ60DRAFT_405685 [Tricladium varicosporioides]|nr:hypothetical protein BGZ60DRAFT_405685 [Hymenoscyphus varicosporioides]